MYDNLLVETADGITTITINRPEKSNAMSDDMIDALLALLRHCQTDQATRVIILTGAGKAFCAGGDVNRMGGDSANNTPVVAKDRLWDRIQLIPILIHESEKPVIAAVNGVAAGLGMDLSNACDVRIAGRSARFCASYARIGLVPGGGGAWFLPRLIGTSRALELLWSADIIGAERALELKLVSRIVPDEDLLAEAKALATRLCNISPVASQLIKRSLQQAAGGDLVAHLDQISSHMAVVRSSEDHREAVTAFKEGRPPVFTGR